MGAMAFEQGPSLGPVIEEIKGLIKIYKNGQVERHLIVPHVTPLLDTNLDVVARDVYINRVTNLWARIYVPKGKGDNNLPLLVYFHGGGFCVGSAAWKCYHEFLGKLSSEAKCVIVSVNYRLAPENPLPSAYEDGVKALNWVKQQVSCESSQWWTRKCNLSRTFLGGDSAGANLAYHVALNFDDPQIMPLTIMERDPLSLSFPFHNCNDKKTFPSYNCNFTVGRGKSDELSLIIRGVILIQPFFGGEERTNSEKTMVLSHNSPLSLAVSDTYWRLALPRGANRDHPWCNPPIVGKLGDLGRVLVCIAEKDILRERNMEMCLAMAKVGNKVEHLISQGVGHAFQVLDNSHISQTPREEMISSIIDFINQ